MTSTNPLRLCAGFLALALALCTLGSAGSAAAPPARLGATAALDSTQWSSPHNISDSSDVDSETPALTVTESGAAHVVWEEGDRLYHSRRADGTWSDPSPITGTGDGEQPALDVGLDDKVHLVYVNDLEVFYVAWDGSGWSLPKNVSQTGVFDQVSDSPDIAVGSDGSIHVVAVEQTTSGKRLYCASSDDGSLWPSYVPIPNAYGAGPSIDVAGEDTIHVAYRDESEDDIYVLDRTITAWSLPQNVSNAPGTFSTAPDLALHKSGTAEIVWQETLTGTNQIRYSRGEAWTPVMTLSSSSTGAYLPSLAIDIFGDPHVAWDDEAFPFSVRHTWTSDPGNWLDPVPVYGGSQPLEDVTLYAGPDGVVHAVWTEIQGGKGEILYAARPPHGVFLPLVLLSAGQ